MDVYANMKQFGITLPTPPAKGGVYSPVKLFGDRLAYVSGCGPLMDGRTAKTGKLGHDLTVEEGQLEAEACALNALAALEHAIGDLNRIKCVVKLLVFVASDPRFFKQPAVANGCSRLLVRLFGDEAGCAARSAIGMAVLPDDISVEVEMLVELK